MRWISGAIGALAFAAASPAFAADAVGYGMPLVKIAVQDYQRAIDFYAHLGMKAGPKYNPSEMEITWATPSQSSSIILVHDEKGQMKLAPGGAWLVISVPDVQATAKALRDAGYPDIGEPKGGNQYAVLVVKDPDGNRVELVGPGTKPAPG
jgi:catechol 2,3-dioxygenase-like lactoylglutathione lyase family enzyme